MRNVPGQPAGRLEESPALALSGTDVVSLTAGEPDFATPTQVRETAIAAVREPPDEQHRILEEFARRRACLVDCRAGLQA